MLAAAKHLRVRVPAPKPEQARMEDLNTAEGFGQHVDKQERRWYELVQNALDEWRSKAGIHNEPSASLTVSEWR